MFPAGCCVARMVAVKRGNARLWMHWALIRTYPPCTGFDFVSGANTAGGRLGKVKSCESKAARKSWCFGIRPVVCSSGVAPLPHGFRSLKAKLEKGAKKGGEDQ